MGLTLDLEAYSDVELRPAYSGDFGRSVFVYDIKRECRWDGARKYADSTPRGSRMRLSTAPSSTTTGEQRRAPRGVVDSRAAPAVEAGRRT